MTPLIFAGCFHLLYLTDPYSTMHALTTFSTKEGEECPGVGGGNGTGWLCFRKSDFHGLGTCLVVRTLRGKSLMMHAYPFLDLSPLDGISFWQGPHTCTFEVKL